MNTVTPYHHENLKEELIETGIDYVNKNGYDALSLRKLAAMCNVSHAAIYSHFANKGDLFEKMKDYVKDAFTRQLEDIVIKMQGKESLEMIYELADAYMEFFLEHPNYYSYVYSSQDLIIEFDKEKVSSNYRPFDIFKEAAIKLLKEENIPESEHMQLILGMWGTVHGITGIAIMPGTKCSENWRDILQSILHVNFRIGTED